MESALDDEILAEQFTRNVQFFGREGQLEIAKAFVIVVGLGVRLLAPSQGSTREPCCIGILSAE